MTVIPTSKFFIYIAIRQNMERRMVANRLLEPCAGKLARTVLRGGRRQRCLSLTRQISLVWIAGSLNEQIFFDGRLLKMVSVLASMTSAYFTMHLGVFLPQKEDMLAMFDCRVWNVPLDYEAANYFIWREGDATRNSVSMAAQAYYSHKALHGKGRAEMHEMLFQKGVNWNDYPRHFKRGTYVRKRIVERPFTTDEMDALPEKHAARSDPNLKIRRTVVMVEDFPPLTQIVNRNEVILEGADPIAEGK